MPRIKCAICSNEARTSMYHESIQALKDAHPIPPIPQSQTEEVNGSGTSAYSGWATERMMNYIQILVERTKGAPYEHQMSIMNFNTLSQFKAGKEISFSRASALIDALKLVAERPRPLANPSAPPSQNFTPIPDGRYCLMVDHQPKFYKVNAPQSGRWAGHHFVLALIGQPGTDYRKIRISERMQKDVLLAILKAGVKESMLLFGEKTGNCGKCGAPLSDPESLARNIGPICFKNMGW